MDSDFRKQIEQRLKELNKKQLCQFAWLCGVRALPFLGIKKDFAYWQKNDRQKHLYSVFNALDVCAQVPFLNDFIGAKSTFANAHAAADDAYTAYVAVAYDDAAAYATYAVANAAVAAYDAAAYDAYAAAAVYAGKSKSFEQLLLNDIEAIKINRLDMCEYGTAIYGEAWGNFQESLKSEDIGCAYWAGLYENLFNHGFDKLDKEELRLRLSVTDEAKAKGAAAVAKEIVNIKEQGAADVQRARLILIGSAGAGKTTLARKLKDENASLTDYDSTHGVNRDIELDINGVLTQIWDFGGQVIYHASHRCFMSERCIYILVVNTRKNDDYREDYKFTYWLDTVKDYAKNNAKVFIVINEQDDRKYNFDGTSEALKAEYKDLIQDFYAFNIGNDKESLRNFKAILSEYIEVRGGQKIGAHDKKALDEIKIKFNGGSKLLDKITVDGILEKYDIKDKPRVLNLFDTLGVALNYDNFDDVVIDPYWITHGIYKVIDYMQNSQSKQPVYKYQFKDIFKDESDDYPENKLEYIFDLMAHYKIGFKNSGAEGLFVPCVAVSRKPLGTTEPELDNYIVKFNRNGLKEFPAGFFDKFIADNAEDMNKRNGALEFWQTGMVLINNETNANAIVEILENREIVITAWGQEKKQYVDTLIRRFDMLLKEFDYVAIGKEDNDMVTGKPKAVLEIYSKNDRLIDKIIKTLTVGALAEKLVERLTNIFMIIPN